MDSFYESGLYLNMVRSPQKSLQHFCTGQTELQRIAKNISFRDLQYSLMHSKMLQKFLQYHPLQHRFDEEDLTQLCLIKNITNEQNKFYLRKALNQYQCYRHSVKVLEEKRKIKYDKLNNDHQKLLMELWQNLMPKQQLTDRISDQWITIGFQANDPATDFRGAGYLGLINLVNFSRNKKCRSVFKWALHPETTYFFCSAGLFFTMTCIQIIKEMIVPVELWIFEDEKQIIQKAQLVYNMLFLEFDDFWKLVQNKSIIEFNNNLLKFKKAIKSRTSESLKQRIIYWEEV